MTTATTPLRVVRTPDKPGPGPMPDTILRALDITIGKRVTGILSGDYRSAAAGFGTELARIRQYEPGDDVRQMDWNVTARTGEAHVRVQVAERVLTTWLLLDTSPSMSFGTADRRKADVAEGVALAMGHIATRRGNRIGAISFGDAAPLIMPPAQGRPGMLALLQAVRREPVHEGLPGIGLAEGVRRLSRLARFANLIVVVSDFRGQHDWRTPLIELAGRHEVIAVEVQDPREQELPNIGELWLVDPETGRQLRVDTAKRALRERFAAAAAAERRQIAAEIRDTGARHVVLSTQGDWLRVFAAFLLKKGDRR